MTDLVSVFGISQATNREEKTGLDNAGITWLQRAIESMKSARANSRLRRRMTLSTTGTIDASWTSSAKEAYRHVV